MVWQTGMWLILGLSKALLFPHFELFSETKWRTLPTLKDSKILSMRKQTLTTIRIATSEVPQNTWLEIMCCLMYTEQKMEYTLKQINVWQKPYFFFLFEHFNCLFVSSRISVTSVKNPRYFFETPWIKICLVVVCITFSWQHVSGAATALKTTPNNFGCRAGEPQIPSACCLRFH